MTPRNDLQRLFSDPALLQVLRAMGDGLAVADADGRLVFLNPAAAALLKVDPERLRGNPIHQCHADPSKVEAILDQFGPEKPYRKEALLGDRWLAITATPIRDEVGLRLGSVMAFTDVTDRHHVEALLKEQNQELTARQSKIDFQMEIAQHIQQSMLPEPKTRIGDICLHFRTRPIAAIGGDFAVVRPDQSGCWIFLGDVMGKGPSAAQFVPLIYGFLNEELRPCISPDTLLENLNRRLHLFINDRFVMFASLLAIRYDKAERRFRVATAGHEGPIFLSDSGSLETVDVQGSPLGIAPHSTYERLDVPFSESMKMLLVTDGVSDSLREAHGFPLETSLPKMLQLLWEEPPAHPFYWLESRLFSPDTEVKALDDMSVMYVEFMEEGR